MLSLKVMAIASLAIVFPQAAFAYIGPGLGAGALGVVLGVIGSVLLALFAILYYPVKRMLKRRRAKASADGETEKSS
ncbi:MULTISPECIES: hypothetical protein [unclassified Ruegeria]|uniref:hypothetical protein n=1 Tax=unclassified Ruegeria TaxID=2625375 RepID=UPI0020C527D5|nr:MULTISPECIES: hypothetical protein [unclassified Ruegeria]